MAKKGLWSGFTDGALYGGTLQQSLPMSLCPFAPSTPPDVHELVSTDHAGGCRILVFPLGHLLV